MNSEQSRTLIKQTFMQAYDKGRFQKFATDLLNHIDKTKEFSRNSQYIKDAFKDHVQRFERLGTYTTPKNETLDVLVVHVTKESKLERARTAIRIPYGFMCDSSSKNLREFILKEKQLVFIEAFPERDDPRKRLFEAAKMSTCIILVKNVPANMPFVVRTHDSREITLAAQTVHLSYDLIKQLDAANISIPLMDDADLAVVKKLNFGNRLRVTDFGRCYEGEINLTFHKKYLGDDKKGYARMVKGAAIQRYLIKKKMSQGDIQFLDQKAFFKEHNSPKTQHHLFTRIVMQGMTGVNEKSRLKMAILDEGTFCGNSVNYILLRSDAFDRDYLLSILNSRLLNWYFKLFSTNSNVNGYEVDNLPIVVAAESEQQELAKLAKATLKAKHQDPETDTSALESEIDRHVYALYGLTKEEIALVEASQAK